MRMTDEALETRLRQTLHAWAEQGTLPPEKLDALLRPVRRHRRRRSWLLGLTAAACLLLLLASPQVRARAAELVDGIRHIVDFVRMRARIDPMWAWAEEHQAFREVMAEASSQGYTVRVHRVFADPTQTTLIYTVEGPRPFSPSDPPPLALRYLADGRPFGHTRRYSFTVTDGVLIMAEEMEPLPSEKAVLTMEVFAIDETVGTWRLEIPVSRETLAGTARTVEVGRTLHMDGVTLEVERVTLSPAQTVLEVSVSGGDDVILFWRHFQPVLLADGIPLPSRGGFQYAAVPEGTKRLALRIDGYLEQKPVSTLVPLEPGAVVEAPGGWPLRVEECTPLADGRVEVVISYPFQPYDPWRPYEDWFWIDQHGNRHPVRPRRTGEMNDPRHEMRFILTPSGDQTPVHLEAGLAWVVVEGPWEIEILN